MLLCSVAMVIVQDCTLVEEWMGRWQKGRENCSDSMVKVEGKRWEVNEGQIQQDVSGREEQGGSQSRQEEDSDGWQNITERECGWRQQVQHLEGLPHIVFAGFQGRISKIWTYDTNTTHEDYICPSSIRQQAWVGLVLTSHVHTIYWYLYQLQNDSHLVFLRAAVWALILEHAGQ